jgi:predicted nucleotidyltransferase
MDMSENRYLAKVKEFIRLLSENGVPVAEAYLFGSAARGESTETSDIDVAVVSRAFQGILFHDINSNSLSS